MHRYGEPDFDRAYMTWGFHNRETQIREAESVLDLLGRAPSLRILDLACGIGTHAVHWAKQGHRVTGVDISETFLAKAREEAEQEGVKVEFLVGDLRHLDCSERFDVVTWIEKPFFDEHILTRIVRCLRQGGHFIGDLRNPEHPLAKSRSGDWRTWREENGVFKLERHETDRATGKREDVWITIDPEKEIIEEKVNTWDPDLTPGLDAKLARLRGIGFSTCELRTMAGAAFHGGAEPYWLWVVARK
jgi:SAM-dependent methyltransferase